MKMKRTLSLVLALVMVLGTFTSVFAEPVVTSAEAEAAAGAILKELKVLDGNLAGDLMLNNDLKREDAIVLLSRLMGEEEEAKAFPVDELTFEDITNPFYHSYVEWAVASELTKGTSETNFGYNRVLAAQDFATMLLRALGYEVDAAEDYEGALALAKELGLVEEDVENKDVVTRGIMAVMTVAALNTKMKDSDETLAEKLDIVMPPVEGALAIESFEAKNVNTLVATFNQEVDEEVYTLAMKKGTGTVAGEFKWNEEETVATFTSTAKLTNGTYTVEVTSEEDEDFKITQTIEIESQKIDKIVVLNDVALTGSSDTDTDKRDLAYVYYDVLDQYGESIRSTTSINWSSSETVWKTDRHTGEITLKRVEKQQFVFGEKIFITGVDSKTGKSSGPVELTVGQPRALDKVVIEGFVKKGTSKIIDELPAGFKKSTYYMVFTAADQNGNKYSKDIDRNEITLISDNPLLIEKLEHENDGTTTVKTVIVDGDQYGAVFVQPGMNIDKGGEVNIMVISSRTGNQTTFNVKIGDYTILTDFDLLNAVGTVTEDETAEIEFQALDQNGDSIENFKVLARQKSMNALSFNAGQGKLVLTEQKDGTAKLNFIQVDKDGAQLSSPSGDKQWARSEATNGINRPVSLTSIVTGGGSSNLMLQIEDKARPVAIKDVKMSGAYVENGEIKLALNDNSLTNTFTFIDQYGETMTRTDAYDFFKASQDNTIKGRDFENYTHYVRMTYKGDSNVLKDLDNNKIENFEADDSITLKVNGNVTESAKSGMALQFDIVRENLDMDLVSVSPNKLKSFTVVDITQVRDFGIKDISKVYLYTDYSNAYTGKSAGLDLVNIKKGIEPKQHVNIVPEGYENAVSLTGTYGSNTVTIPKGYYKLDSDGVVIAGGKIVGIQLPVGAGEYKAPVRQQITLTVTNGAINSITTVSGISLKITTGSAITSGTAVTVTGAGFNIALDGNTTGNAIALKIADIFNKNGKIKDLFSTNVDDNVITLTSNDVELTSNLVEVSIGEDSGTLIKIDGVTTINGEAGNTKPGSGKGFVYSDFYNLATATWERKDASTVVGAEIFSDYDTRHADNKINTATTVVKLSDAVPVATTITGPEEINVRPDMTIMTTADIKATAAIVGYPGYTVKDQYGRANSTTMKFKVSEIVEAEGYADDNFKVSQNDTDKMSIVGAERGDTFTLVITAGSARKTVKVTVGADKKANITDSNNNYLKQLINGEGTGLRGLEQQRLDMLN